MATIKIKQIKSRIDALKSQKETSQTLELRKISQVAEVEGTPSCHGMTHKVHRLVSVID